jgi:hypothetical protein
MRNENISKIKLLEKVLIILKNKKAGKKVVKDFANFLFRFKETRESFWLTFPEKSATISADESISQKES